MRGRSKRRGHSLLEMLIAVVILVAVVGVPGMILSSSSRAFGTSTSTTDLDLSARRALDRIAERLTASGLSGLVEPDPAIPGVPLTSVTFRPLLGLNVDEPIWGPEERIELQMAPGEVLNGQDSNGNGLVDDGRIVWFPDASNTGRAVVLCTGVARTLPGETLGNGMDDNGNGLVDERGLVILFEAGRVELILAVERRDTQGRVYQQVVTRSVALRN